MNELEKQRIFVERTQRKYPRVWEGYLELIQHELMSKDELAELNFKKRKAIVRYAYDHTVFYRRLYDSIGFNPRDLKSEDDWNALPVVTKEMVRENFEEMIADQGVRKYGVISNTGGSTGV